MIGATSDKVYTSFFLFLFSFPTDLCLGVPQKWRHSVDSCFALGIKMVKTRSTRDDLKLAKGKYLPKMISKIILVLLVEPSYPPRDLQVPMCIFICISYVSESFLWHALP